MAKKKVAAENNFPAFDNLRDFYKYIKAAPGREPDFDIREVDTQLLTIFNANVNPFRHNFYCVSLYLEGGGTLNTGFYKIKLDNPALYFNTPNQILSWKMPEGIRKEYYIIFTDHFLSKYKQLADLVYDLPFFHLDKAIPFEMDAEDTVKLTNLYLELFKEYNGENSDRFEMLVSYTTILLVHIRRLYRKFVETDKALSASLELNDHSLIERFKKLVKQHVSTSDVNDDARSMVFYAKQLLVHPNHLNAVVKRVTGKPAISFIHKQLIIEAKSILAQTSLL